MRKLIILLILILPTISFGQSFAGNYRAVFFNFFSEPKTIVAEFEVKTDNSLIGKVKVGDEIKIFNGTVEKNGKFEALSERQGETVYKLKGKFDKNNKISFVQRVETGSGLNKSVSENGFEGTFAKVAVTEIETPKVLPKPQAELIDNGRSWLNLELSNPLFGVQWTDFAATVGFGNSAKTPAGNESKKITGTENASDYFVLHVKSKIEGQQNLTIRIPNYTEDKKSWRQNELRIISYREVKNDDKNSFLAAATLQTDSRYADGKLEIVKETEMQIVFKLTNFKIKRLSKDDFVTINGFIYADK